MSSIVERRTLVSARSTRPCSALSSVSLLVDGLERLVGQPDEGAPLALDGVQADL